MITGRTGVALLIAICAACRPAAPPGPRSASPTSTPAPGWFREAVCYEVFVRSFRDSDGDGIGDLAGLIERLDYINDGDAASRRDLGASCIWLMPVAVSPSYHGYDVVDHYRVDPDYGTEDDFRRLVTEAHRRGIRVIVDLVLNHVSSRHPSFQRALADPRSPYREWFRWSPRHPGVKNPWGGDNWHRSPIRDEYYYGFFWSGMPDLDYTSRPVREEASRVATYWLREMGVDGFRLDAVAFLVEDGHARVQHAPGTHEVLRELGAHVRAVAPGAFTIGEVWDGTDALTAYYPDQLDAYFAFEVSDSLIASARDGVAGPVMRAVARANDRLPDRRWAPFLRNHDQERTLTALQGDVARARAATTLLLTLPGIPFLYYGEEIGMSGSKDGQPEGDMGVRTPMQWSPERNAGFTSGSPWYPLRPDWRSVNVMVQSADSASLLGHVRRLIHLRMSTPALASGDWVPLSASDPAVVAYLRRHEGSVAIVLVNLGARPASAVSISSSQGVLAPGTYRPRALLGPTPAALEVASGGAVERWVPLEVLAPRGSHVMELP